MVISEARGDGLARSARMGGGCGCLCTNDHGQVGDICNDMGDGMVMVTKVQ